MGYTTLPNSGLRKLNPVNGSTDWATHFDYNINRLNNILLKIGTAGTGLLDVNHAGWVNNATLRWDAATSKWIPWVPDRPLITGTDV